MFVLENIIHYSSIMGGILLVITLLALAKYTWRQSQTTKAVLFLLAGLAIVVVLIYSILFPQ